MRKLLSIMTLFVISLLTVSMVSALSEADLDWGTVKVNGDEVNVKNGEVLAVEEGQTLNIKVGLEAKNDLKDIEVDAKISGYEYSDYENLQDSTHLFDVKASTTKYVNLEVALPNKLDKDEYWLRLRVLDKNSPVLETTIKLAVEPTRHGLDIADVVFSPGNTVKAGRSLLTTVLVENYGDKNENDVKVSVSVPELGVKATEFVDVVKITDDHNIEKEDVPEMFLPIPATAASGEYEVVVSVEYDNYETVTKTYKLNVLEDERFQNTGKLVLAAGPETQSVATGKTATYALALTNAGAVSKAYLLEAATGGWGTVSLSESLVVLEPGKNQVVYIDIAVADDATVGEHLATLTVKSGNEVLDTVVLKANVVEGSSNNDNLSLRSGLEIALIVLVVLLVIVGLIIGFSRLKKDDDNEEEDQTYY
ncbi:MAG: hypothetical protein ABH824_03185 [Nanoarchaeota archaeon]|nr:hypothetical protein [Nanoarchaeota archaeon]MBU1631897.1 hypothetical protein [Nanoarchaeota archaeon]MBU1875916.1 hypothetical protein [Nanoarchaeota archaeon]